MTQKIKVEKTIQAPETKKVRFSGVELLRIIAILLICLSHAVQTSQQFLNWTKSVEAGILILKYFSYSGQIGNLLFVICSSYFLLDSTRTKKEKAINLLLDSMFISIFILIGFVIGGHKLTADVIIKQIFPDVYSMMWFIPIYVLFYAIHPLLNAAIEKLDQKGLLTVCLVIFGIYGIPTFLFNISANLCSLINFVLVYFVVAYVKKYCGSFASNRKKNIIGFCIFFGLFTGFTFLKSYLSVSVDYFKSMFILDNWTNPILLPALICLFNIFNSFKFKNKFINYMASCSLFVYCIHENYLLRRIIRPQFYKYVFGNWPNLYFLWIILCAVGMFIGAYILSVIYKETIHRATNFLSKQLAKLFDWVRDLIYKIVPKPQAEVQAELNEATEIKEDNLNNNKS